MGWEHDFWGLLDPNSLTLEISYFNTIFFSDCYFTPQIAISGSLMILSGSQMALPGSQMALPRHLGLRGPYQPVKWPDMGLREPYPTALARYSSQSTQTALKWHYQDQLKWRYHAPEWPITISHDPTILSEGQVSQMA